MNLSFCISTYNNLPYFKLAVESVRKHSYWKDAPFIVHAENCTDGTNEWLGDNADKYNLEWRSSIPLTLTPSPSNSFNVFSFTSDLPFFVL